LSCWAYRWCSAVSERFVRTAASLVSVKVKDGSPLKVRIVRDGYWTRKLTLDGTKKRVVVGLVKRDDSKTNPNGGDDDPPGALPRSVPPAKRGQCGASPGQRQEQTTEITWKSAAHGSEDRPAF
jgi:hypothetical protein